MTTPDFEEWLDRQEVPIEYTTDVDAYKTYLEEELGIHGGSLAVAESQWTGKYDVFEPYGIRPITRHYTVAGLPKEETRYGIMGEPGLWGRLSALRIAEERAVGAEAWDIVSIIREWLEELL